MASFMSDTATLSSPSLSAGYPQVVRVYATRQAPDHESPWQARTPSRVTGSGVVVSPTQILTGAHVVADATFLQVQKVADPDKAVARVAAVCHDCDLALLEVAEGVIDGIEPAEIGELPDRQAKVQVVGFPIGGEQVSVTAGVVSRVELQRYTHSQRQLLAVTVDAAINKGNSGGPVFRQGKVVGIAFQKLTNADSIGEMVPAPLLRHFLEAIPSGRHAHIPGLGVRTQGLENPLLRRRANLREGQSGVLVIGVEHDSSVDGVLQQGDALLALAGHPIANNGTIVYDERFRTKFGVLLGHYHVGDTIELEVLRHGERLPLEVTLRQARQLVPRSLYDAQPSYFVYGGLVFQVLTRDFLATWSTWWDKAPPEFLDFYYAGVRSEERREVVVLTQILADEINIGYGHLYNESIVALDGVMPRDLADLVERVDAATGELEIQTSRGGVIVFESEQVRRENSRILERYHIPRDRSADLLRS